MCQVGQHFNTGPRSTPLSKRARLEGDRKARARSSRGRDEITYSAERRAAQT